MKQFFRSFFIIIFIVLLIGCVYKVNTSDNIIAPVITGAPEKTNNGLELFLKEVKPQGLETKKVVSAVFEAGMGEMFIAAFGYKDSPAYQKVVLIKKEGSSHKVIQEIKNDSKNNEKVTVDIKLVKLLNDNIKQLELITMLRDGQGEMLEILQMEKGKFKRIYDAGIGTMDTSIAIFDENKDGIDEIHYSSTYSDFQNHIVTIIYELKDTKFIETGRKISYGNLVKKFIYPITGEDIVKCLFEAIALGLKDEVKQLVEVPSYEQHAETSDKLLERIFTFNFKDYIGNTFNVGFTKKFGLYPVNKDDLSVPVIVTFENEEFSLTIQIDEISQKWKITGFNENFNQ